MAATLCAEERARAERYLFAKHSRRFVLARGTLRSILGGYLGVDAREIRFEEEAHGKPRLAGENRNGLSFNVSHSSDIAIYAVSAGRELGVDVERHRSRRATDGIMERFFAPGEVRALRSLPAAGRIQGFYDCWTRKEAFIKAIGRGLSFPLDGFEVSVTPGRAAPLSVSDPEQPVTRWTMTDLSVAVGYSAALVVEGAGYVISRLDWTPLV